MKAIAIIKEVQSGLTKGRPNIGTDYTGFVQIGQLPGAYCVYVIVGSAAQLTAINANANTLVGVSVSYVEGTERWAELNVQLPAGVRTKINAWRTANGLSTIPASTTWLQVVKFAANHFDMAAANFDVWDI